MSLSTREYRDFSLNIHEKAEGVIKAQMELTYRCNLHCRHCYTDPFNDRAYFKKEMTFEEIKRILDEMAELGILWLNFTGGEIFARRDFFEIYDYAHAKGFILVLYTNGTMITEDVVGRLKEKPPFFIDVSCHSALEKNFDWFTKVEGSYKHFLKGMELLKDSGLPFRMKSIAMNWNKEEQPLIRDFIRSFGLPFQPTTALYPRLNGDVAPLAFRLSPQEAAEIERGEGGLEESDKDCLNSDDRAVIEPAPDRLYRCTCGAGAIHVNAWAELGTCTLEYEARASLRQYSLKEAVELVFNKIHSLRYGKETPCRACRIFMFCDKKPTSARWEFKDAEAPNPYECDLAFLKASRQTNETIDHPLKNRKEASHAR